MATSLYGKTGMSEPVKEDVETRLTRLEEKTGKLWSALEEAKTWIDALRKRATKKGKV